MFSKENVPQETTPLLKSKENTGAKAQGSIQGSTE